MTNEMLADAISLLKQEEEKVSSELGKAREHTRTLESTLKRIKAGISVLCNGKKKTKGVTTEEVKTLIEAALAAS